MALPPVPFRNVVINIKTGLMELKLIQWLNAVLNAVNAGPQSVGTVSLSTQSATVNATAVSVPTLPQGLYRMNYYQRIMRAAGVSSSLITQLAWVDGGVSCTFTGAAMTANTVSTTQSASVVMNVDAGTVPTYTLTYASAGSPTMQYSFHARLELVP